VILTREAEWASTSNVGTGSSLGGDSLANEALGIADGLLAEDAGLRFGKVARSFTGAGKQIGAFLAGADALENGVSARLAQSSNNENRKQDETAHLQLCGQR
jgi:hypothetical protein